LNCVRPLNVVRSLTAISVSLSVDHLDKDNATARTAAALAEEFLRQS
jgi:hypothetical protein